MVGQNLPTYHIFLEESSINQPFPIKPPYFPSFSHMLPIFAASNLVEKPLGFSAALPRCFDSRWPQHQSAALQGPSANAVGRRTPAASRWASQTSQSRKKSTILGESTI